MRPRRYPPALRVAAVQAALAARAGGGARSEAYRRVGEEYGVNPGTLGKWVAEAEKAGGASPPAAERAAPAADPVPLPNRPDGRRGRVHSTVKAAWWVVGTICAFTAGSLVALQNTDFRDAVCPTLVPVPKHSMVCGVRYDPVSPSEAGAFLVGYHASATASNPERAWDMLAPELKAEYSEGKKEFAAAVRKTLWGELVEEPIAVSGRNAFISRVNTYTDGDVSPYEDTVRLRRDAEKGIVLVDRSVDREAGGQTYRAWAYLGGKIDLRKFPDHESDITMPAKDHMGRGGRLRALCQLEVPSDSLDSSEASNAGLWIRTNQGWLHEDDLDPNEDRPDVPACSKYILNL